MLLAVVIQISITFANINLPDDLAKLIINIILMLVVVPSFLFVGILLGFHIYLTKNSATTN